MDLFEEKREIKERRVKKRDLRRQKKENRMYIRRKIDRERIMNHYSLIVFVIIALFMAIIIMYGG